MERRKYLKWLAGTGALTGLAGCSGLGTDDDDPPATDTRETPATTETPTSSKTPQTPTATPTATPTPEPDRAPRLATATTTPQGNGKTLAYHVVAEDDQGLAYVAVRYGDQTQEWNSELGRQIDEDGQLTDLGQAPEDGQVTFVARDTANQETREERYPDQQAPTLSELQLQPTENVGEVTHRVEGEDNIGLEEFSLLVDGELMHQNDVSGQSEITVDTTLDVSDATTPGEQNSLTARLEDWNGNTTQSDSDTYVRKYDKMADPKLSFGVEYLTWAGDKFGNCFVDDVDPEPAVGQYDEFMSSDVVSRHIDQMNSAGIQRLWYVFNGAENVANQLESLLSSELITDVEIGAEYTVQDYRWFAGDVNEWKDENPSISEEIIPEDMGFLRQNVLNRENALRYDGRPVFKIWNAAKIPWSDKYRTRVLESYGSYQDFVEHIRTELTVDGEEPFLIAGVVGGIFHNYGGDVPDKYQKFLGEFDATTTWVASGAWDSNNRATWEEVTEYVEQNYSAHREFTDRHDMEFIPMVFPGFDDRGNTCWGKDRYTPRSLDGFDQLLMLADKYRTTNMIDVATWNDWTEGTQIEPGSFRGEDYGTDYLEVIRQFQQEGG